ncbi:hypothetical protein EJ08DRAFT_651735 [Tothia fuscella]|uniref:Uncharacterized protein n=1 Tax=Tothia fuscella TaxID=1048955 RepID=A0A9P4NLG0_9PEZI|nr:hypothetical protein EJ08DRAFT_651735 [Tothia fuscella]
MDSMRSLNTSLPSTSSSRRQAAQKSEAILAAFREAALSVTNLYKTSASLETDAYRDGYQDALEDLLGFMDKRELGLQDGDGWGIRKWATERYQRTGVAPSESDEDGELEEQRPRSSSPTIQRKTGGDTPVSTPAVAASAPIRSESAPPVTTTLPEIGTPEPIASLQVPQAEFSFRTTHQYPTVHDIDMENPDASKGSNQGAQPTVQVNIIPRPPRNSRSGHNPRQNNRTSNNFQLGTGAGMKRRLPHMDFFDLGNLNSKDAFGGGKRGRFS